MALGGAPGSRPEHPGGTSSTRGVVANRRRARCESACLPGGVGNPGRPVCLAITTSIRVAATTCTRSECSSTSWPRSAPSKPCGSVNAVRGGVDHSIPHLMCRKLQQNCAGPIARFGPAPNAWAELQVGPPVGAAKSATSGSTGRNGVQSLQTYTPWPHASTTVDDSGLAASGCRELSQRGVQRGDLDDAAFLTLCSRGIRCRMRFALRRSRRHPLARSSCASASTAHRRFE